MGSTTYTIPSVFTAIDKFSAPMAKMASKVEAFASRSQRAVNMANGYFNKLMTPLTKVKNMLGEIGIYIGLWQLTRAVRSAFNTIADFEQANVNLASVTEKDSIPYLKALSDQARLMAVNFGIAAVEITNLQYELTKKGFSGKQILDMTPSIALGAKAFRAEAADVADVIGGVLKAYDMASSKAGDVVNKVLYVANATSADFESFKTQLPIISRVAKIAGVEFEKVLASLGVLRDVQIHTATGSTSFKNFILDAVVKEKKTFDQAVQGLMKADANGKLLNVAFKKYGKKTVVTAVEFARQLERINELTAQAKNLPSNYTEQLALMQLNTLKGRLALLKTAWEELILSVDTGNGPLSKALKQYLDIGRAVLLMAAGSDQANQALSKMNGKTKESAQRWLYWLKIAGKVIVTIIAVKALIIAAEIAIGIFNGVVWAATIAVKAWTGAQWLLNLAMTANPIGLIIAAIVLFLVYVGLAINAYEKWGAAALHFLGGPLINLIVIFVKHWDSIINAFKNGGLIEGIKAIGSTLISWILYPIEQIMKLISQWTGMKLAENAYKGIQSLRLSLGDEYDQPANIRPAVNPKVAESQSKPSWFDGQIDVNFNNAPRGMQATSNSPSLMPVVTSTMGY